MPKRGLVSVIVPVYNIIGKGLEHCCDSLIVQSYKNLEIILVDDGSADFSAEMCDSYAMVDNSIIVIHKPNGGVSSARNVGLRDVSGEFVTFVDGDDYLDCMAYENAIVQFDDDTIDISMFNFFKEIKPGVFQPHLLVNERLLRGSEQIESLLRNEFDDYSCCDKVFRKCLIEGLSFDETVTNNEDFLFLYKVMKKSRGMMVNATPYYYYCSNSNSATTSRFNKKKMTIIDVWDAVINDVKEKYPEYIDYAIMSYVRNNLMCAQWIVVDNYSCYDDICRIKTNVVHYLIPFLLSDVALGYKLRAIAVSICWKLFVIVEKVKVR